VDDVAFENQAALGRGATVEDFCDLQLLEVWWRRRQNDADACLRGR
jgi:hypothetical protein